jgi:hypothetical protein
MALAFARAAAGSAAAPRAPPCSGFAEAELDRYARHILLREIGGPGQKRLKAAGAGGGGRGAGVSGAVVSGGQRGGHHRGDRRRRVERSNLQRQVIHTEARIGMPKVFSAERDARR